MALDQLIQAAEAEKPQVAATTQGLTTAPAPTLWGDRIGAR